MGDRSMLPILAANIIGAAPQPGADHVVEARIQVHELFFAETVVSTSIGPED
jgi:hypothetical protein